MLGRLPTPKPMGELSKGRAGRGSIIVMVPRQFMMTTNLPSGLKDQFGRVVDVSPRWFGGRKVGSVVNIRIPIGFTDAR